MTTQPTALPRVIDTLIRTLGLEDRAGSLGPMTPLFGSMPELDSLAVVELAVALEGDFDIVIDDEDFTDDVFGTIGSLAAYVERQGGCAPRTVGA